MKKILLVGSVALMAAWLSASVRAQVPQPLYLQGLFLNAGAQPNPGAHSITATVFSNGFASVSKSMTVTADASGLAHFLIDAASLPRLFQTCTNTAFQITGGPLQSIVTAPYTFQAANLPQATENFTVWKDLTVNGKSTLKALTVERDTTMNGSMRVGGRAHFTNTQEVVFNNSLYDSGGLMVGGAAVFNYGLSFNNASATAHVYGATNNVVLSNATIRSVFTLATNNPIATGSNSGTAPDDGLLVVYVETTTHTGSGVSVSIGSLQFTLRTYLDVHLNKEDLRLREANTFPVPKGTSWSVALIDSGDKDDIDFTCYWVSFRGDG